MEKVRNWDLIIIGAGIVGCAAAYYATKSGLKPLVIERDSVGAAQSGRALGFVRRQGRDLQELPMMIDAMEIWRGLEEELQRSVGWRATGNLWCAVDDAKLQQFEQWLELSTELKFGASVISPSQIEKIVPGMRHNFVGALYTPDDGLADPLKATKAFYEAAKENGAEFEFGERASRIETSANRVTGVYVGESFYNSNIVICVAGAGSSALLRRHNVMLPQDVVRATMVRLEPNNLKIEPGLVADQIGLRQGDDGSIDIFHATGVYDIRLDSPRYAWWFKDYLFEPTIDLRLNPFSAITRPLAAARATNDNSIPQSWQKPYPNRRLVHAIKHELRRLFPNVDEIRIRNEWGGYIETTPDMLPVIGAIPGVEGLLTASGYSGHGFGTGPVGGKRLIELATGKQTTIPKALSPDRFRTGKWKETQITAI